jgi:hypothetical protein
MLRLKLWLAAAGAFIVALFAAYWNGKSKARDEGYADTRKRMDEVDSDTANSSREWLRERGER